MRIRAFVFLMMSALASVCFAQQVSEEQAFETALQFLSGGQSAQKAPGRNSEQPLTLTYKAQTKNDNDLYVFNREGGGFVIVSADARTVKPVLGYSDSGSFDAANMPPQLQDILSQYQQEINYARENLAPQELLLQEGSPERKVIVEPLIKTQWSQGEPYNGLCPMDSDRISWAGCVACAMAQVMNYWRWPERGIGSHRNLYADSLFVDFSKSVYDWDNMAITYTADTPQVKIDAVQKLMYDCGISVDMDYHKEASAAVTTSCWIVLTCYFNYSPKSRYIVRSDYETEWDSIMASELDAGRPILYSGREDSIGHAFICDGYDSEHYFHFNLGWGGSGDGFYLTTAVNGEGGNGLNNDQYAVIGIYPDYEDRYPNVFTYCYLDDNGDATLFYTQFPTDTFDFVLPDYTFIDGVQYPIKVIEEFSLVYSNECTSFISSEILEYIGRFAFYGSSSLQSVYISNSVKNIKWAAFGNCNNLNTIIVSESNPYFYSPQGSNVIIERSTGRLIQGCNYSVLPSEGIKAIGENAFDGFDSLTVVRLPESVEVIEDDAFTDCSNLKEVYFGSAVNCLGERLFRGCPSLTDVYFCSDAAPVIAPPDEDSDPSIPYGCNIHVKPSALESFKALEVLSSYTIVPDVPETTTATPSIHTDDIEPQYYDLLGRPVENDYKGLKIGRNRKLIQ